MLCPYITCKIKKKFRITYESSEYIWNLENPGDLTKIKVSGSLTTNGTAKIYIEKNNQKYLIFDNTKSEEGASGKLIS